ncbi:MAG TPA: DUF559 domain-containing protein [Thermoanaerobaculia bacterium]|nr:DUF559 domain-containing protein [Thermoanaerobaculia bacterium]
MKHQARNDHERERELRRNSTRGERDLWKGLRRLATFKFRRQHRIVRYVVDFYCPEVKLVVEVDGSTHEREYEKEKDRVRDQYLRNLGIAVLRFRDEEIFGGIQYVVERIEEACLFL